LRPSRMPEPWRAIPLLLCAARQVLLVFKLDW
jgi:hypothetical protein